MKTSELMNNIRYSLQNRYNAHYLRQGKIGYGSSSLDHQESTFEVFTDGHRFKVVITDEGEYENDMLG